MAENITLSSLFFSALLSSTLLPGGSEILLLWMKSQLSYSAWTLLLVATAGNTVGAVSSWGVGWILTHRWSHEQQVRKQKLHPKAIHWITRYGAPILLLSWLPLIGDALCLAAGWFRLPFLPVLFFIGTGKAVRFGLLLALQPALSA